MPYYDYRCKECQTVLEVKHGMSEKPKVKCTGCLSKKPCQKLISGNITGKNGNAEAWDYGDIRKVNPKFLRSKDGKTRVPFDPGKHGHRKGGG